MRVLRPLLCLVLALVPAGVLAATVRGWPDIAPRAPSGQSHPDDYAVIVGVETHLALPVVPYAQRDARAVAAWARLSRGIPGHQVDLLLDPDGSDIARAIARGIDKVGPSGTLWVYFSGHGALSASDGTHLLLGADGGRNRSFSLDSPVWIEGVQDAAADDDLGHAMIIVDAGFSGTARGGQSLGTQMAVGTSVPLAPDPKVVTWLASGPGEWAGPLEEARHGLFTWHVVAGLRGWADGVFGEPDGVLRLEELQTWAVRRIGATGRAQTPSRDPRGDARSWLIGQDVEPPPTLDQTPPARPLGTPAFEAPRSLGAAAERDPDPDDPQDVLATLRRTFLGRANNAWSRAYSRALQGDLDGLRIFVQQYGTVTFYHQATMYEVTAPQVPLARRMLANGGRPVGPLVPSVVIPAGDVDLGSPVDTPGREAGETLTRVTRTRRIAMSTTEIPQSVWVTVTGTNPHDDPSPTHPITGRSWYQVATFCNALSALDGFDPAYTIQGRRVTVDPETTGWRLPTEAEWMAGAAPVPGTADACRAGNVSDRSRTDDQATCDDGFPGLSPVTAHRANPLGLYGMHGNAAEWTADAWRPLPGVDITDPDPGHGSTRVVKGASYLTPPAAVRAAARAAQPAASGRDDLGFRVVRTLPPGAPEP